MQDKKGFSEFLSKTIHAKGPRKHTVKNSYGVRDAFKWYRANKCSNKEPYVNDKQYKDIINKINALYRSEIIKGNDFNMPLRMGRIETRKYETKIEFVDGKLKTNLPIDWSRTLNLWYEDAEARLNKTLIRFESDYIYRIIYNKKRAMFKNKTFFRFNINRQLKKEFKNNIESLSIEAFSI